MTESEIQLNQEGTGPNVRTITITEPSAVDASGNAQADLTRHQQVVTLTNSRGDLTDRWDEVLAELRDINTNLTLLLAVMETP